MTLDELTKILSKPYLAKSELRAILKEYTDSVIEKCLPEEKPIVIRGDKSCVSSVMDENRGWNDCRQQFLENYQLKDK